MEIIGILTRDPYGWASTQLILGVRKYGLRPFIIRYKDVLVEIFGNSRKIMVNDINILEELDVVIVRPIGRSSLDQALYRVGLLYMMEDGGIIVINKASAIEKAVDKYRSLHILSGNGVPTPKTLVSENPNIIFRYLDRLGENIVIKPMFGSRGLGSTMLSDRDSIWRILQALAYNRNVLYLQEYLRHEYRDIRAFVIGDRVVACMYRENPMSWKSNISRGGIPKPMKPDSEIIELAVKSADLLGCEIAGVDILESDGNRYVLEVNSQPTWKGLQSITKINIAEEIIKYVLSRLKR
jgi:RimK family alpha-L-glutamate ligase